MYHFFVFGRAIMITSKTDLYSIKVLQTNPYKEQLGARRAFLLPRINDHERLCGGFL